jgi:hypothetical protein
MTFPFGAFGFTATDCPATGQTVTVTLTLPYNPALPALRAWKHNGSAWAPYTAQITHDATNYTVIYQVTDGGLGDNDGAANNAITDPIALGYGNEPAAAPVPALGQWALALMALMLAGMVAGAARRGR